MQNVPVVPGGRRQMCPLRSDLCVRTLGENAPPELDSHYGCGRRPRQYSKLSTLPGESKVATEKLRFAATSPAPPGRWVATIALDRVEVREYGGGQILTAILTAEGADDG